MIGCPLIAQGSVMVSPIRQNGESQIFPSASVRLWKLNFALKKVEADGPFLSNLERFRSKGGI